MKFYNIAHHCNTIKGVNQSLQEGANAIECDMTPYTHDGQIQFSVFHNGDGIGYYLSRLVSFGLFGTDGYTQHHELELYLNNLRDHIKQNHLALVMFDMKLPEDTNSQQTLNEIMRSFVAQLKKAEIPPEITVMIFNKPIANIMSNIMNNLDYPCFRDICFEPKNLEINSDHFIKLKYSNPHSWIQKLNQHDVTFAGFGVDSKVIFSPMQDWSPLAKHLVKARDSGVSTFKKVYFWTLNNYDSTIEALKWKVDGIIHDRPAVLTDLLKNKFAHLYEMATQIDTRNWHREVMGKSVTLPSSKSFLDIPH